MDGAFMEICGSVKKIIFRNPDTGYIIFRINDSGKNVTCIGNLDVKEKQYLRLQGEFVSHETYGRQFRVISSWIPEADSVYEIEKYLSSGEFKGIGKATAKAIVDTFGDATLSVIENEPLRLTVIKRVTEKMAISLSEQVREKKEEREALVFLQKYGISIFKCKMIYAKYRDKVYTVIAKNPYQLLYDIRGIGFDAVDEIAAKVGISKDAEERIKAAVFNSLNDMLKNGDTCINEKRLAEHVAGVLKCNVHTVKKAIDLLDRDNYIVRCAGNVYTAELYFKEYAAAQMLLQLDYEIETVDRIKVFEKVSALEKDKGICFAEQQKNVLLLSIKYGVLIITGSPGTGKTTGISLLTDYYISEGKKVCLAAPTARAAKRMSAATGVEARTIHRMLEVRGSDADEEKAYFLRNEHNPLEADVVILDEMSMVDIHLFYALLKAIKRGTKLILVGDKDQLFSVKSGQVFKDLIDSGCFQKAELTRVFRQDGNSDIYVNATLVNQYQMPLKNKDNGFSIINVTNSRDMIKQVIHSMEYMAARLHVEPQNILIMTTVRKGAYGMEALNIQLQEHFNRRDALKNEIVKRGIVFRENDKVMHIKNSYNMPVYKKDINNEMQQTGIGVFNGEVGVITQIDKLKERLTVRYEDYFVIYKFNELDVIELAYAQTVHKVQGSEGDGCILIFSEITKNVLYTAITRAKKMMTVIGKEKELMRMLEEKKDAERMTGLDDFLKKIKNQKITENFDMLEKF